jgi:hypothetical protein
MYAVCSKRRSKKFCLYRRKFTTRKSFFSVEQIFLIKLSVDTVVSLRQEKKGKIIPPSFLPLYGLRLRYIN